VITTLFFQTVSSRSSGAGFTQIACDDASHAEGSVCVKPAPELLEETVTKPSTDEETL
jgi:hypothetical protein